MTMEIEVIYDNGFIHIHGNDEVVEHNGEETSIRVPMGNHRLVFNLEGDADFLTSPVQWVTPGEQKKPMPPPANVKIAEGSPKSFSLEILNDSTTEDAFPFFLMLISDNEIVYRDPVLLNEGDPTVEPDKGTRSRAGSGKTPKSV